MSMYMYIHCTYEGLIYHSLGQSNVACQTGRMEGGFPLLREFIHSTRFSPQQQIYRCLLVVVGRTVDWTVARLQDSG